MPSGRTNNFPWKWVWPRSRDLYNFWHTIEHEWVCCVAVWSAILATAWLLVFIQSSKIEITSFTLRLITAITLHSCMLMAAYRTMQETSVTLRWIVIHGHITYAHTNQWQTAMHMPRSIHISCTTDTEYFTSVFIKLPGQALTQMVTGLTEEGGRVEWHKTTLDESGDCAETGTQSQLLDWE